MKKDGTARGDSRGGRLRGPGAGRRGGRGRGGSTPTTTTTTATTTTTTAGTTATAPKTATAAKTAKGATGVKVTVKGRRYLVRWNGKAPAWKVTLRVGRKTASVKVKGSIHAHTFVLAGAKGRPRPGQVA